MIKIAILGDISLNDDYVKLRKEGAKPFEKVTPLLKEQDIVVGNLECFAPGNEGENELKKPRLRTDIDTLGYLKELNISAVSLANNHAYDHLESGFINTTSFLNHNNIRYMGAGLTAEEAEKPLLLEKCGHRICLISYLHEDTNPKLPEGSKLFFNRYQKDRVKKDIEKYKNDGYFVILLFHWGGKFEGGVFPDRYQHQDAIEYVKLGADIVAGTHSHTLQPFEKVDGKYIFYSLGNFCFADIHSEGKTKRILNYPRFTRSVIVMLTIKDTGYYSVKMVPVRNKKLHIAPQKGFRLLCPMLKGFCFRGLRRFNLFWVIYGFTHKHINPYFRMLYNFGQISYVKKANRFFKFLAR